MVKTRIIPCLDVKDGRVVKGINFLNLIRTSLGEGVAREITVNHLNDTVEIEIEHDIQ